MSGAAAAGDGGGGGAGKFVANVVRRTWDLSEYEEKAKEKARLEEEAAASDAKQRNAHRHAQALVVRAPLKHREKDVALESRLGKHTVISNATPLAQRGGYYCQVCECLLKDSITYLDHINGKKHQRALGMTLRAERSTLGEVRNKLEEAKRKSEEAQQGSELEQRLARFQEEVEQGKRSRKEQRRADEAARAEAEQRAADAEAQFQMGATSSDARKRKKADAARDGHVEDEAGEADGDRTGKKAKPAAGAAAAAAANAEPEEEEDPEAAMMRAMGFSTGFAKGKNK
jgi:U4/U6.U5 tri-snRNP component SNU23